MARTDAGRGGGGARFTISDSRNWVALAAFTIVAATVSTVAELAARAIEAELRRLLEQEHFDRVIVSATDSPRIGLSGDDLEWLLERVPAEVMSCARLPTTHARS